MNAKAILIMVVILMPGYALTAAYAQQDVVKVEIAVGSKKVDNSKFYVPKTVTVDAGTTVEWVNLDDDRHTVTDGTPTAKSWGTVFDSGVMKEDETFRFTFNAPGTYNYLCAFHPWMLGAVIVKPVGGSLPVEISVATDKATYTVGESVNVMVSVSPPGENAVTIEVLNPANAALLSANLLLTGDGKFTYDFKLEGDLAVPGPYTLKVTYSGTTAERTFVVEEPAPGAEPTPEPTPGEEPVPMEESADVRVAVKKARDFYVIRVKSAADSEASVYGMAFDIPDQVIEAFRGPRDWSKPGSLTGELSSATIDNPIEPGGKAVFKLKVASDSSNIELIHWTAYSSIDNVLDSGDTKPLIR